MASSHDLASIHPWTFQTTFPDCAFFPHSFSYDYQYHDSLTLNKSLTPSTPSDTFLNNLVNPETTPSSTVSDQEPPPKRHKNTAVSATGKVTKRKSRASKRSLTTYITADPLNFRQMVQQVTGVRPENSHVPMPQILKPEPHRPRSRLPPGDLFLPTLDTSSPFLLDRQDEVVGSTAPAAGPHVPEPPVAVVEAAVAPALEFDAYLSYFPTLESW